MAPPAGWHVPSRDSRFVVRFTPSPEASYPSILLTAEDHEGIAEVTSENVDAFVREVDAAVNKEGSSAKSSARAAPMVSGAFVGAMYQKRAKVKADLATRAVDRLILETVAAGRKYRLELRTEQGTVDRYRGDLLAVAEGIRFVGREPRKVADKSGEPSAAPPVASPAAAPTGAAEKNVEKKQSEPKDEPKAKQDRKPKRESMFEEIEEE
ncbi:MAG: hypothetical protein NTW96_21285 [Planctomycetia bacterium]|nr:hypothetical protein [Planctomycetia bacterium]